MRALIVLGIFISPYLCFAGIGGSLGGGKSDLDLKDSRYVVDWPSFKFGKTLVPVNNVCVSGERFKSIMPISNCIKTIPLKVCTIRHSSKKDIDVEICRDSISGEKVIENEQTRILYTCLSYENKFLETSRVINTNECIKTRSKRSKEQENEICIEYENRSQLASDVVSVSIINKFDNESVDSFEFQLPSCSDDEFIN